MGASTPKRRPPAPTPSKVGFDDLIERTPGNGEIAVDGARRAGPNVKTSVTLRDGI